MKILVDNAMPYWQILFAELVASLKQQSDQTMSNTQAEVKSFCAGDLKVLANQRIADQALAGELVNVEYLLIRSTTKVNAALLGLMPKLRFVGTATAGYDHIDINTLAKRNIAWYAAGGCNAQAVAQYVVCACLHLAAEDAFLLSHKTIAIVGHGKVGHQVANSLRSFGATLVIYDPPQQHDTSNTADVEYARFSDVLAADIICLHAPLNSHIDYPSMHMFNAEVLAQLQAHQYLINAGRGELIDNKALLAKLEKSVQQDLACVNVVLDVWEHEPDIITALIPYLRLSSAHIAGHTLEGKAKGTYMLYQQLCKRHDLPASISLESLLPAYEGNISQAWAQSAPQANQLDQWQVQNIVKNLCEIAYQIQNDDRVFRLRMAQSPAFAEIRQQYPIRREFSALPVNANNNKINELLRGLGFIISNDSNTPLLNL